mgnify:CR=1 FL=1
MKLMFNPCYEYCYLRLGRQYKESYCNENCEYAATVKELREELALRNKELQNMRQNEPRKPPK